MLLDIFCPCGIPLCCGGGGVTESPTWWIRLQSHAHLMFCVISVANLRRAVSNRHPPGGKFFAYFITVLLPPGLHISITPRDFSPLPFSRTLERSRTRVFLKCWWMAEGAPENCPFYGRFLDFSRERSVFSVSAFDFGTLHALSNHSKLWRIYKSNCHCFKRVIILVFEMKKTALHL